MKTVAVVTTSRADYSHLRWVLHDLRAHDAIDSRLVVTGAHWSPEFGAAAAEIEADGFDIDERVECLLSSDTDVGMAKTIGVAVLGLTEVLARMRPDILLLIADRYEMLAPAAVATALRIPIAHIEGGEVSEGAIDDAVRNALTKLAHLHLVPTEQAAARVRAMGEEPWRVVHTGAPSLDHLRRSTLLDREALSRRLGLELRGDEILVSYHPVTLAEDTLLEVAPLFAALEEIDAPLWFCFPNADAGSRALAERARVTAAGRPRSRVFVNLDPVTYWSLLRCARLMLGNSSSGIMETPSLELPTVNVGVRQAGRQRARNIIDAVPHREAIVEAIRNAESRSFRDSLAGLKNPYGDGRAAERIVGAVVDAPPGARLIRKAPVPASRDE